MSARSGDRGDAEPTSAARSGDRDAAEPTSAARSGDRGDAEPTSSARSGDRDAAEPTSAARSGDRGDAAPTSAVRSGDGSAAEPTSSARSGDGGDAEPTSSARSGDGGDAEPTSAARERRTGVILTRAQAERLVPRRELAPVQRYLEEWSEALAAELELRIWGFGYTRLGEYPDSFGRVFYRGDAPVPQLWFGLGWALDDAPDTLPSWGASLQVDGAWVRDLRAGTGGLRGALQAAARDSGGRLGIYESEEHAELAEWRSLEEILASPDQERALLGFWAGFLDLLFAAAVPEAMDDFVGQVLRV